MENKIVSTGGGERGTRLIGEKGLESALLANLYLHYVLDQCVDAWRKRQAKGDAILVRYADDLVLGFERRDDAAQFFKQFGERLAKLDQELHPDKTRLIEFARNAKMNRQHGGEGKPETFDFLGFTHSCGIKRVASSYGAKRRATDANHAAAEGRAAHQQNIFCVFPFFTSSGKRTATVFDDDSIRSRSGGRAEPVKC